MPIRPSLGRAIRQLVDALEIPEPVRRESAIARLALLGTRATEHLLRVYPSAGSALGRAGMLRALEASGDSRALPVARAALQDSSSEVVSAALGIMRRLLTHAQPEVARDALDVLVAIALDPACSLDRRVAVLDALRDLPSSLVDPIHQRLAEDTHAQLRQHQEQPGSERPASGPIWRDALAGKLPASPNHLKDTIVEVGPSAPLTDLRRIVDRVRAEERTEPDPARREEWRIVRGAVHQVLATRGSRLALYDLRESLLDAGRMPLSFLAALEEIGDASCLEPLAAAYEASARGADGWWRDHIAAAFRAILRGEGLTRRHAVVKRTLARRPAAEAALMARSRPVSTPSRTRPPSARVGRTSRT